ncbi:hypothetical protein [Caballeronia insecticola]|uniref:Uncharacterized protein n=1 Tax=Caballeronia insecticola TaxID=758793 RepID=R4X3R0_9BURK|nr:hypothetical protein [Caballeronia insecticola]BAN27611.1 putative uncharacterized protein [Caballeronia insecticola]
MKWRVAVFQIFTSFFACMATMAAAPYAWADSAPPNPFLSAPVYAITHFDSAQTNDFPYPVSTSAYNVNTLLPATPQVPAGPINLMTLASTDPNYMWGVSATGVNYMSLANNTLTAASLPYVLPSVTAPVLNLVTSLLSSPITTLQQAQNIISQLGLAGGGGLPSAYSVVDKNNILYTNYGSMIYAFGVNALKQITVKGMLNTGLFLQSGESITGVVMTYDGKLVVLGSHSATVVDPGGFNQGQSTYSGIMSTQQINSGETISNSAAVDPDGGIYIVSNATMYKFVWTGTTLSNSASNGAWSSSYPSGDTYFTAFGSGSGSTPALMGFGSDPDQLVVITDGKARMHLVAFWRNGVPSGFTPPFPATPQIAGMIQVNCGLPAGQQIQTDQSVSVYNYGAFVVNNIAASNSGTTPLVDNLLRGTAIYPSPLGVERFQWDTGSHSWSSVWSRPDISSNSMVPAISSGPGVSNTQVFTSGNYGMTTGQGWVVTGMNWNTGATQFQVVMGSSIVGNGFYGLIQFLPNGDLLFNSFVGPTRVRIPASGSSACVPMALTGICL